MSSRLPPLGLGYPLIIFYRHLHVFNETKREIWLERLVVHPDDIPDEGRRGRQGVPDEHSAQ
jgi:hypothetical protein